MKLIRNRVFLIMSILVSLFLLAACTSSNESEENKNSEQSSMGNMDHSGSGELPEGLKVEENPTFEVDSKAIINADHMEGMEGAEATIIGAFDTIVYSISYTPTDGGEKVSNHKWVIHEELENAGEEPLRLGSKVTIDAEHMSGMDGVIAEIDSAEDTTVYMVDYMSTTGEKVTNHKWVTESELETN